MRGLALRALLAAGALAVAIMMAAWQRGEDDCNEAGATVVRSIAGEVPERSARAARATLLGGCHDTSPMLVAAGVLERAGREREALPLVRQALRDEPDNYRVWAIRSLVLAESDPRAAHRARERALDLNPLAGR
jgi:hypothetical protein